MRYVVVILALATVLVVGGCGGGGTQPVQTPQPPTPAAQAPAAGAQTVAVTMSEFAFRMAPAEVPSGKVVFAIENVGAVEHSFIIEELGIRTEQIRPGQKVTASAEVKAGTYTVLCDVPGHKEAGMQAQLTVR